MKQKTHIPHMHGEDITARTCTYHIHVGGSVDGASTRDPVGYGNYDQAWESNLSVRLENLGDDLVRNPWIIVNGKRQWRCIEDILDEILQEGMSDAEKARAIWEFARRHRYHSTTADDEVKDTVKMLNVYGYTLCWDEAYTVANLWQAAGLKIRRGLPHGHCTTEVFFDGRYHLLDSDEHLLVLLRDNRTIAGEEELARDHDLMKRAHAYGILSPESRQSSEQAAALFVHSGPRTGSRPFVGGHRMDLDLRPGEALIWEWADRGKYHGHGKRPSRLCNGRLHYEPGLDANFARWAEEVINLQTVPTGLGPSDAERESILVYRIQSPYVIVGGQTRLQAEGSWTAEISRDGEQWSTIDVEKETFSLDPHFLPDALATYRYYLRLRGMGSILHQLSIETDLQMAPLSLPEVEVGDNEILYTDENDGPRQVRITHVWNERADSQPPPPPSHPLFPESKVAKPPAKIPSAEGIERQDSASPGASVDGTQFTFSWEPVPGAADYHFRLSPSADMKYCLSPSFEKLISKTPSSGKAEWHIPYEGILNPGQTCYWQVRSRSADSLWGPWSDVWSFTPQAPGIPLDLTLETDWETRRITLHWHPNSNGNPADHYEIYGSDERGFTASRQPYPVVVGRDREDATFPANLIAVTADTCLTIVAADLPDDRGNRAFYRIVAVDADGLRSGPSDYAEAPRPFIYSTPSPRAVAGDIYRYQIKILRSSGDLRCVSDGPHRYLSAFRDADQPRFLLDEGPAFISLDAATGLLTAAPGPEHLGFHTVTFRVQNGQGGADIQGFDLEVIDP